MHSCFQGGYLVGPWHPMPADPTDYHCYGLPLVGCSRIRCSECGRLARNVVGLWFKKENESYDRAALYETEDLSTSPLLGKRSSSRMYLCRCKRWLEEYDRPLDDPDPDMRSANLPWRCSGHPAAEPPCEIDGARVANEKALIDLVVQSLHGQTPPNTRPTDKDR